MNDQALDLVVKMVEANKADADKRFDAIDEKLDELLAWKWKLAGVTLVIASIGGVIVQILINKLP